MDLCNSFNLSQLFTKPRDTSLIDLPLTCTSNVNFIANCDVNISAVADHCLVVVTLKLKAPNPRPFYIFTRSYKSCNPESWLSDLGRVPFHIANIFDDFNDQVDVFNKLFLDCCVNMHNNHARIRSSHLESNNNDDITRDSWHKN